MGVNPEILFSSFGSEAMDSSEAEVTRKWKKKDNCFSPALVMGIFFNYSDRMNFCKSGFPVCLYILCSWVYMYVCEWFQENLHLLPEWWGEDKTQVSDQSKCCCLYLHRSMYSILFSSMSSDGSFCTGHDSRSGRRSLQRLDHLMLNALASVLSHPQTFLSVFSSQAMFAFLKYTMVLTKVTTRYFSSAPLQISAACQYLLDSRWALLIVRRMFWPKWRIQPYPSDIPQIGLYMLLFHLWQLRTDCGKTFMESKTADSAASVPAFWN